MRLHFINSILFIFIFYGCAPVFNEFQGADTVGKGNTHITPYMSTSKFLPDDDSGDDSDQDMNDNMGIRIAYGINDISDIHLKLEKIDGNGGFIDGSIYSLGFKYFLYNNKIEKYRASFYLPITYAEQRLNPSSGIIDDGGGIEMDGDDSRSYTLLEPTLIMSSKLHELFDFNFSTKFIQQIGGTELDEDIADFGISFNVSGIISFPEFEGLSFIPEYGILFWDGDKYSHTGFGMSVDLSKFKN